VAKPARVLDSELDALPGRRLVGQCAIPPSGPVAVHPGLHDRRERLICAAICRASLPSSAPGRIGKNDLAVFGSRPRRRPSFQFDPVRRGHAVGCSITSLLGGGSRVCHRRQGIALPNMRRPAGRGTISSDSNIAIPTHQGHVPISTTFLCVRHRRVLIAHTRLGIRALCGYQGYTFSAPCRGPTSEAWLGAVVVSPGSFLLPGMARRRLLFLGAVALR